ncbi:MAG: PKD domain-containing protein, partial [Bacteroidales bacterium]|nr:PKD domain-containing protein [Bacteroidales bacterium]
MNPVVSPLETTTYTVVITDAASQSVSESVTITVFPLPSPPAIDQVTQPTCAVPSGTVALSGLPGGNWILYVYPLLTEINGSGTTYSVSGLAPGSYTFAVRNLDQCLSTVSAAALVNPVPTPPDDPLATVTHQPDCSDPYGTILFTAQPGVEYSLGTGYQATSSFSGLEPGTYSLYVRLIADNTCVSIAPFSLTVIPYSGTPAAPQPGSVTQPGCITTTGSVVLGGLPAEPWTLMPGNISGNTESILVENLLPGTYNFYIILTSSGCSSRSSRVLINPQPPTPPAPAVTVVHPTCAEATGSITIDSPLGTGYSYSVNGIDYYESVSFPGLTPGNYNVTARNSFLCVSTAASVTVNAQPPIPALVITNPSPVCNPGTANLTAASVTEGSSPDLDLTYWTDAEATVPYATPAAAVPGVYYIKATNPEGCFRIGQVTVSGTDPKKASFTYPASPYCKSALNPEPQYFDGGEAGVFSVLPAGLSFIDPLTGIVDLDGTEPGTYTVTNTIAAFGGCPLVQKTAQITVNPVTIPGTVTGDASVCTGTNSTTLTLSGHTGDILRWEGSTDGILWFNIENTTTSITVTNLTSSTQYRALVQSAGCSSLASSAALVTVNPLPETSAISGPVAPACNGQGVTYSVGLTLGSTYAWTIPPGMTLVDGGTGPNNSQIIVNVGSTGGIITVSETNSSSCTGAPRSLTVNPAGCNLVPAFSANILNICQGAEVIFTDNSTGTTGSTSYLWDFGEGASPRTRNSPGPHTITYTTGGSKDVTLTLTDGAEESLTKAGYITVYSTPVGGSVSAVAPVCGTENSTLLTLNSYSGTVVRWESSVDGINWLPINVNSSTYTAEDIGATTFFRAVVGNGTCPEAYSASATITFIPQLPVGVSISASANPVCSGSAVTFTATPVNGGASPVYQWQVNGSNAGANSPVFTINSPVNGSTIRCIMTSSLACNSGNPATSNTVTMTVNPIPTITGTTPASRCDAGTVTLGA